MPRTIEPQLAAALSMYILSFLRLATVIAWFSKRSKIRKRVVCAMIYSNRAHRRIWMENRPFNSSWWETTVLHFDDNLWIQHFRMRQSTFWDIVGLVEEDMKPGVVTVREPVPTCKRVAIAIFHLATGQELKRTAKLFGVHEGTVHRYAHRFCIAMIEKFGQFVSIPDEKEGSEIAERISKIHGMPQVIGALGSIHLPVMVPQKSRKLFKNDQGWPSIILQAVVDDNYLFRSVFAGKPGTMDFYSVFCESKLFQHSDNFPKKPQTLGGTEVPLFLTGAQHHPLLPWLMTPYEEEILTPEQESFNWHIKTLSKTASTAFDRLKARWQILQKPMLNVLSASPRIVAVCCMLHNICEKNNTEIPNEWFDRRHVQPFSATCSKKEQEGVRVRDALCRYMAENYPLVKSEMTVEVGWGEPMDVEE